MIPLRFKNLSRRRWLGMLGAGSAMLPFVPTLDSQAEESGLPQRLVVFWTANGLNGSGITPGAPGAFDLTQAEILAPLAPFQDKTIWLEGVDLAAHMYHHDNTTGAHDPGHAECMTATVRNQGPSIDQFIAARLKGQTPFDSIGLGVQPEGGFRDIFFREAGVEASKEDDPAAAFQALFADLEQEDPAAVAELRARRKSILDSVATRLTTLQSRMTAADRERMDAHLDALQALQTQIDAPLCSAAEPPPGSDYLSAGRNQLETIAAAFRCDLTRVAFIQWDSGASGKTFGDIDVPYPHHALAHSMSNLAPGESYAGLLRKIGRWYAERLAEFCENLAQTPVGNGTMLDQTTILWCSEHGGAGHERRNMPYTIIGGGGYFDTGRFVRLEGRSNNDLYVSLCHAMGLTDVTTFGTPQICTGPIGELQA
jgi:hypothetical protein